MDNMQAIERFSRLEASITLAAQACHRSRATPRPLDETLSRLEHEAHLLRRQLQQRADGSAEDPARLFGGADELKSLGDRAGQLCDEAEGLDSDVRERVLEARDEIAQFRRQLHGGQTRKEERPEIRPTRH
jgi:hypothetical protein